MGPRPQGFMCRRTWGFRFKFSGGSYRPESTLTSPEEEESSPQDRATPLPDRRVPETHKLDM